MSYRGIPRHSSSYGPQGNDSHPVYNLQSAASSTGNMIVLHPSRQSTTTQRPAARVATPLSPLRPEPPPISRRSTDDPPSTTGVAVPWNPLPSILHRPKTYLNDDYYSPPTTPRPKAYVKDDFFTPPTTPRPKAYFNDGYFTPPYSCTTVAPLKASIAAADQGVLVPRDTQVLSFHGRNPVTEPLDAVIRQLEAIPEPQRRRNFVTIAWQSVRVIYDELIQDFEVVNAEYSYWAPKRADRRAYDSYHRATSLGQKSYNKLMAMKREIQGNMQENLTERIPMQEVLDILYQVHECLRNAEAVRERVGKLMAAEERRDEKRHEERKREHEERMYEYKERAEEQSLQRGHRSLENEIRLQQYAERKEIHEDQMRRDERLASIVKRVVDMCRTIGLFDIKFV